MMAPRTFVVLLLVGLASALVTKERKTAAEDVDKDSRIIIVSVRPEPCTTTSSTYPTGTCYKITDCIKLGGTGAGSCALGFGTCCYFVRTCGASTVGNTNTFISPSSTTSLACSLQVRLANNICQLKLDFDNFELAPPNSDGNCVRDSMRVTGTGSDGDIPVLCGSNTGQHMYIDVNPSIGNPTINIQTDSNSANRNWRVNVQQIPCGSADLAPAGCTQYYTATSDIVESFNYVRPASPAQITSGTTSVHLNNQQYRVCVARSQNCIRWTKNSLAGNYAFMMSDNAPAYINLLGTAGVSLTGSVDCPSDYVVIPQSNGTPLRYCGLGFPNVVPSSATSNPFTMDVVTDGSEPLTDAGNVGFSLRYTLSTTTTCQ